MSILDELIADHRRLCSLLDLFEHELLAYDANEPVDLQLMQDVATYYAEYFTRYHHPLEDCLFERLLERKPQRPANIDDAIGQHDRLKQATDRLLTALDRVLHGTMVPRAELVASGQRFLRSNREHMRHEESQPFEQARQCLTVSDWDAINAAAIELQHQSGSDVGRRQYDTMLAILQAARPDCKATADDYGAQGLRYCPTAHRALNV